MTMTRGTVGNAETWTVTFVDANDAAVAPDGDVTWEITIAGQRPFTIVQDRLDAVAVGTYELNYTPTVAADYTVKASAIVGGVDQATPAQIRSVVR
jgi:hypothetical protein